MPTYLQKVMQELQEDWENGLQLIQRHTPELSYAEMREAMDQVQCTKQTMVDQDLEYFQKNSAKSIVLELHLFN